MAIDIGDLQGSIGLEDDFSGAIEKVAHSVAGALEGMEKSFGTIGGTAALSAGIAVAAIGSIGAAIATLGYQGSTLTGVENAFDSLAHAAGLSSTAIVDSMNDAAKGTVDSFDLMTNANKILQSGAKVTVGDFELLTQSARELGKAAGKDTASELELLSSAFTSGRTKALAMQGVIVDTTKYEKQLADSLGITTDQLSKAGQQEAARTGILAALQERLDKLGISQMSFKEILQATSVSIGNFFDDLKKGVDQSDAVRAALDAIGKGFNEVFGGTRQSAIDAIMAGINGFANAVTASVPYVVAFAKGAQDLWTWLAKLNDEYKITSTLGATLSTGFSLAVSALKALYDIVVATVKVIAELPPWMKDLAAGALAVAPAIYGANKALETISVGANAAQVAWGFLSAAVSKREWVEAILGSTGQIKTTMTVLGSGVEDTAAIFTKMFVNSQTASTSWGSIVVTTFKSVGASVYALLGPIGLLVTAFTLLTAAAVAMLEIPWVRTMTEWITTSDSWTAAIARIVLQMPKLGTEAELAAKKTLEATKDAGQGIEYVAQTVTEQINDVIKNGSLQGLEDIAIRLGNQGRLSAEALRQIGDAAKKFQEQGGTLPPALANIVAGMANMDAATKKSSGSLIDHGKVAEDAAKKMKAFNDAWTELNSLGATVEDTLMGVSKETQAMALDYLKAGASTKQLEDALHLTANQADALKTKFETQKMVTEALTANTGKLHQSLTDIINDQMKLAQANTAKYFEDWKNAIDLTTAAQEDYSETWRRLNMTDYEIAVDNITRWEAKQYAALDANEAATSEMYGVIANTAAIKMEEVNRTHDAAIAEMKAGWDDFGNLATKWLDSIPNLITAAFTGGGGMREAMVGLGAQIGGDLGKSLGTSVAGSMSGMLNDVFGSKLGGALGNAIGPAAGAATSASMANILSGDAGIGSYVTAGASIGGQIGMAAGGPLGAAIGASIGAAAGAIASLIRGKPEWKKVGADIGRDMGVEISEELSKAIAETEKVEGLERIQAATLHLMDIINEAGGLTASNVEMFTGKLRDAFVYLGRGEMELDQVTQTLDSTFQAFAENALKGTGLLSDSLIEIIQLDEQFGTQSAAITQFIVAQTQVGVSGLEAMFGAFKAGIELTQTSATAFGDTIAASFGQLLSRGVPIMDALQMVKGATDSLTGAMKEAGVTGSDAFTDLANLSAAASDPIKGPLIEALLGADQALKGLFNSGLLTQESFSAITTTASETAKKLQEMGVSGQQIGLIMQPQLQTIWELQQRFNYTVDEGTQAMLDQAVAAGTVGEAHKSAQDRTADAVERVARATEGLAKAFGVDLPEAVEAGAARTTGALDTVAGKSKEVADGTVAGWTDAATRMADQSTVATNVMTSNLQKLPGVTTEVASQMLTSFSDMMSNNALTADEKIAAISQRLRDLTGVSQEEADNVAQQYAEAFTDMQTKGAESAGTITTDYTNCWTSVGNVTQITTDTIMGRITTMTNLNKNSAATMQADFQTAMTNEALTADQKIAAISTSIQNLTGLSKVKADEMALQYATAFTDMQNKGGASAGQIGKSLEDLKNKNTTITGGLNRDWIAAYQAMVQNAGSAAGGIQGYLNQVHANPIYVPITYYQTNDPENPTGAATGAYVAAQGLQYFAMGGIADPVSFMPRGTDVIAAMLTVGEGVVNTRGMGNIGRSGLAAINAGHVSQQDLTGSSDTMGGMTVNVTVNVNGPVYGEEDYVKDRIAPVVVQAIADGVSRHEFDTMARNAANQL